MGDIIPVGCEKVDADNVELEPDSSSPSDNGLESFAEGPISEEVSTLVDLLSQNKRAFLLGAGCSRYAGLPLMAELTTAVLSTFQEGSAPFKILDRIRANFEGAPRSTIEDYMSELVDWIAIASRRRELSVPEVSVSFGDSTYSIDDLSGCLSEVKAAIAKLLNNQSGPIHFHHSFVDVIHNKLQMGKEGPRYAVDYFVLNYDTLLEDSLALQQVNYVDGFCGGVTGWWNPSTYDDRIARARVFKLHGSIDWCCLKDDVLPRRIRAERKLEEITEHVIIWPASTKYREAQRDPFAQMLESMRCALRPKGDLQTILVTCGYSFNDAHINLELDSALRDSSGNLTIIAFSCEDRPQGLLGKWHDDHAVSGRVRIYCNRGFFHGEKVIPASQALPWWKFEILTRLLGGER